MQNSVIVEIRLQHLHSFTNSLSTPSLLSYWQPQIVTHQFSKISSSTCATFTPILDVVGQIVQSSLWIHIWPFANTLHHFLTCCPPTTATYTLSPDSEFWQGKHVLPITLRVSMYDPISNITAIMSTYHLNIIKLTLPQHNVYCPYYSYKCYLLQKINCLNNTKLRG